MESHDIKIPITRLKDYLKEVGIAVTTVAELAGINPIHLHKCLAAEVDGRNGSVRTISDDNMVRLQDALHQLALRLKYTFILYNTDLEIRKRNGCCYCPDSLEQIKTELSPVFSIIPFMEYSLGWSYSKVRNVLDHCSISYGNLSQDDVNRINLKLAEVATRLDLLTVVKD